MRMQDIIARLRAGKKNDEGFTLIELLVVVVIIGVLVAIAVPVYLNYRQGAADKSAQSDVRGAISAIEQYYTNNGNKFPVSKADETGEAKKLELPALDATAGADATITLSDKTKLAYVKVDEKSYKICATNTGGSNKYYIYNSAEGGSVADAGKVLTLSTCS
jgi:type IV pilus assembly protein PilA